MVYLVQKADVTDFLDYIKDSLFRASVRHRLHCKIMSFALGRIISLNFQIPFGEFPLNVPHVEIWRSRYIKPGESKKNIHVFLVCFLEDGFILIDPTYAQSDITYKNDMLIIDGEAVRRNDVWQRLKKFNIYKIDIKLLSRRRGIGCDDPDEIEKYHQEKYKRGKIPEREIEKIVDSIVKEMRKRLKRSG